MVVAIGVHWSLISICVMDGINGVGEVRKTF